MLNGNGNRSLTVKGYTSGKHLKESNTKGIDITLLIRITASCLLGRCIMHRSHYIGSNGIAAYSLGNTKIGNLNLTVLGNHNILRLNISVNNMIVVSALYTH